MAINPLNISELFRPWRAAGILAFLSKSDFDVFPASDEKDSAAHEKQNFLSGYPATQSEALPDGCGIADADACETTRLQQNSDKSDKPASELPAMTGINDWPEPWLALLSRTRPAPIVWTYSELGCDLTGHADTTRADCLRRLIASLQLPKGSSAFWPVCLGMPCEIRDTVDSASALSESASPSGFFFQNGLHQLTPKVVIMLGASAVALSGLALPLSVPFTQMIHRGRLYVLLPEFSSLLLNTALQDRAGIFLRASLAGVSLR